ncbi:hypothetical protein KCU77_g864, partial [Aureobasidium melanogenum]
MSLLDQIKGHGKKPASNKPDSKILRENKTLRSKLQEISNKVPRYLFRMWHPGSGGNLQLNTTEKITPLALLDGTGHKTVYDMSIQQFIVMTTSHLRGGHVITEFSSWSASPRFVLHYATSKRESSYIAIIDTLGLQQDNGNSIFWVPDLAIFEKSAPGRSLGYDIYDWDPIVTVALFCCKKRADSDTQLMEDELREIVQHVGGRNLVPDDWCVSLCNDVYDLRY